MFIRLQSIGAGAAVSLALFSVGCFGNKNKDVAVAAPAPPPAAYPDTSAAMAAATGGGAPAPSLPANAAMAAANRPSMAPAPAPFSLRDGEQLVPHQIRPGENLSSIAAKYNTSVGRIQSANGMADSRIFAGKTIQVPTSAPPTHLAQGAPAPAAGLYGSTAPTAPAAPAYPATTSVPPSAPPAPPYPSISSSGAISAPPVPSTVPNAVPPGYPATTSYPRSAPAPSAPAYPTPSFEGSRVQFSN